MTSHLTSELVWKELNRQLFAVLGMVTAKGKARTVGVVYITHNHQLYISTQKQAWKARHIRNNPSVSLTIPIHKSVPFMPWIKIPAATITFSGEASLQDAATIPTEILHKLYHGRETNPGILQETAVIAVKPTGQFITYGIGISLMDMRFPEKARGRVAVT